MTGRTQHRRTLLPPARCDGAHSTASAASECCRAVPGRLGRRAAHHRRRVRPGRAQATDHRRHGVQAAALALVAAGNSFPVWAVAAVLLGAGAMVYPTLLAALGDVAHPVWRARAVGVYRFWRGAGFAAGGLLSGIVADAWGVRAAVWTVAALTAASGAVVAARMYETLQSWLGEGFEGARSL